MIKLIVSDMDGTLLNDRIQVSDTNADAIKHAQNEGIDFVIATGRNYKGGYPLVNSKGITCPFIGLNGAEFYDKSGILEYSQGLEKDAVHHIMDVFESNTIYYELITNKGMYSNNPERHLEHLKSALLDINKDLTEKEIDKYRKMYTEKAGINFISNYDHVINDDKIYILKVTAHSMMGTSKLRPLGNLVEKDVGQVTVTASSRKNLEITHKLATKGNAVQTYAKKYDLKPDEVMTLGDNFNDITMLKWAKYGVAMENAVPEAKKAAGFLTSTNEENGVAEAISRVLNGDFHSK